MNNLLIAKIDLLPATQQKEVEDFVQFLLEKHVINKPVESSVIEKRRQSFGMLDQKVFSAEDF